MITVNNFFAYFIKEISPTRYGTNTNIFSIKNLPILWLSVKHLPKDSLKKIEKTLRYSKQSVYLTSTSIDRRIHNETAFVTTDLTALQIITAKANNAKYLNIGDRISKLQSQLKDEYVYRIPLKYFSDIGKIHFPVKIAVRVKCHFETEMKRLSESKKVLASAASVSTPDEKIIFTKEPFIQYEQLLPDKNFRQYLETIMVFRNILRMRARKTPIQKTCEINVGTDSINNVFLGANRQFDRIELSFACNKNDKHKTIYDSYNIELASKTIKSVIISSFTEIYNLTNEKKKKKKKKLN